MEKVEEKEHYINFDEYIRHGEPKRKERVEAWRVAIGLQAVDGLKTMLESLCIVYLPEGLA